MKRGIKENDVEGHMTLDVIGDADKFNEWMYSIIKPSCSGKILEIGSGIGNISFFFIKDQHDVVLSDLRTNYCDILNRKYDNEVVIIDLVDEDFDQKYREYLECFDTVFALNVVEHIEDDVLAIANCKKLLRDKGKLIILVPAFQSLYNNFDVELEHYRRYTKRSLKNIIVKNDLNVQKLFSFNLIGIFGWFLSGRILNKKNIPKGQMGIFNALVPIFKWIDRITFNRIGLSVVCISEK